jgi:DNA topoisomerase IB
MPRLRRSDPSRPGIRRQRAGKGFVYLDEHSRRVADKMELTRIRSLVLPPAWTDVWICPAANGHIQATGTDSRGRRQYRYHDAWREQRDREKFERMLEFGRTLPRLRRVAGEHLLLDGMPKDKVLAGALVLLDAGFFRIGGEEYAEQNGSLGLLTLRRDNARVEGRSVIFEYPAKGGKQRVQAVVDPRIIDLVSTLKRNRGPANLLSYQEGGRWVDLHPEDVNARIRDLTGSPATTKDFRTWNATVLASVALAVSWPAVKSRTAQQKAIRRAVCEVAEYLGNTPAVCRRSYIDPRVVDLFQDGITIRSTLGRLGAEKDAGLATHGGAEEAVIRLLRRHRDQ